MIPQHTGNVLMTWSHRAKLPPYLQSQFKDLDQYIREIVATAQQQVILISPYLSPPGLRALQDALSVAAQRGAWIRVVTRDVEGDQTLNRRAIGALVQGSNGEVVRTRLRVLVPTPAFDTFVHTKVSLVDGAVGYLGSANFSKGGLDTNLDLGVALSAAQVASISSLVSYLEGSAALVDCTSAAIS